MGRQLESRLVRAAEGLSPYNVAVGATADSGVRFQLAASPGASERLILDSVVVSGFAGGGSTTVFICEGTNASDVSTPRLAVQFNASEPRNEQYTFAKGLKLTPGRALVYQNTGLALGSLLVTAVYRTAAE